MPLEFPGKSEEIQSQDESTATHDELWYSMMTECMRILAYQDNRKAHFETVRNQVVLSSDVATTVDLIDLAQALVINGNVKGRDRLNTMVNGLIRYITDLRLTQLPTVSSFDEYLTFNNFKISSLMADMINSLTADQVADPIYIVPPNTTDEYPDGILATPPTSDEQTISESNIFPEGFWELDHIVEAVALECDFYHFVIEVSDEEDYSNIIATYDTRVSTDNWSIEYKEDIFGELEEYISANGLSEKFENNSVRYSSSSNDYLDRGQIYYFRVYQITPTETFGPTEYEDIIYS